MGDTDEADSTGTRGDMTDAEMPSGPAAAGRGDRSEVSVAAAQTPRQTATAGARGSRTGTRASPRRRPSRQRAESETESTTPTAEAPTGEPTGNGGPTAADASAPAPLVEEVPSPALADESPTSGRAEPRKRAPRAPAKRAPRATEPVVLRAEGLTKRFGSTVAAQGIDLEVRRGSIFGVVGPNGAGKTTTLSMLTGLLRPDEGSATVLDQDVWSDPVAAKRSLGILPDRLRLFDRLTGAQLLVSAAVLHGVDAATARSRTADLAAAFGLGDALRRPVADYSVGMAKKIALAATLIHSPRVLVLDEPFESIDPVSLVTIIEILRRYVAGGGTVVLSSHSMDLVQRTCDSVAVIVGGRVLASGTMAKVRGRKSLEDKFVELAGGRGAAESMEWLHSFSD